MKTLIRTAILAVTAAGLIAGFIPDHSAQAQTRALSNQVASQIIGNPTPGCYFHPDACNARW